VLVELGADKDAKTVNGRTPLHLAAAHFGQVEVMRVLVELGQRREGREGRDAASLCGRLRGGGGDQGVGGARREQGREGC
jgi:hypothetical protein